MTDKVTDQISDAFASAIVEIVQAVAGGVGGAAAALGNQASVGAQGTVGGQVSEGGVSAQQGSSQQHTGASHKNDVSAPELVESYNVSMLQDIAQMGKTNAKVYDITATALGLASLGSGANMYQQQINQTGHADEEYTRRKDAGVIRIGLLTDFGKEVADDSGDK